MCQFQAGSGQGIIPLEEDNRLWKPVAISDSIALNETRGGVYAGQPSCPQS